MFADIQPLANSLIENLFGAMQIPGSTENEYIMKGIWFYSLPDEKILDWSKLKRIADDILKWI